MFNAAVSFNQQELNNQGITLGYKAVAATVSATGSVTSAAAFAIRACVFNVSAGVSSTTASVIYQIQLASLQSPSAYGGGYATANTTIDTAFKRALSVSALAFSDSILGVSRSATLGSFASAGATGTLFVDAVFLAFNVTATAATTTAAVTKTKIFAATASTSVTSPAVSYLITAYMAAAASAGAVTTAAVLDTKISTVWHRTLVSAVTASATGVNVIDPKKMMYAAVSTATSGFASASVGLYKHLSALAVIDALVSTALFGRFTSLSPAHAFPGATSTANPRAFRYPKSSSTASALTTQAKLKRVAAVLPTAITAKATASLPALKRTAGLSAVLSTSTSSVSDFRYGVKFYSLFNIASATATDVTDVRTATKLGSVVMAASSSTIADFINVGVKLFALDSTAGATSDPDMVLNAIISMPISSATGAASATADAVRMLSLDSAVTPSALAGVTVLWLNIFDLEPAYRTDFILKEDTTNAVSAEDFTVLVRDDSYTMKTFTKQPSEVLGYDIDMTAWFEPLVDDFIAPSPAPAVTITPAVAGDTSLVCTQSVRIGDPCYVVKVWLSGGTSGNSYKVTTVLNTHDGRVKEVDFTMQVQDI